MGVPTGQVGSVPVSHAGVDPVSAGRREGLFPAGTVESFSSRDFDEVASLPPLWEQHYSQIGRGAYEGGAFMAMTSGLMMAHERSSVGLLIRGCIPPDSAVIAITLCRDGVCTYQNERVSNGSAIVVRSGEELDFRSTGPFEMFVFGAELNLLERHSERVLGRPFASLRRNSQAALCDPAGVRRRLRAIITGLEGRRAEAAAELAGGESAAAFEGEMCDAVLSGLAPRPAAAPAPRAELARLVEEHLRTNLRQDFSIADLCRATGSSERNLHLAFREHIGSTPKAYQKVLRLNGARGDLRSGEVRTTVTGVAARWGFEHLGRFSQDYKAMFGESPRDSLHRRARSAAPTA